MSWNADPDHPDFKTLDVATVPNELQVNRPLLGTDGAFERQALRAVTDLVEELQTGWGRRDADITNRHFANDILWGSPFGATPQGYEQLHAIHIRLKQQARSDTSSLYEIVQVLAPAADVAIAHVRRIALDPTGHPLEPSDVADAFSEIALYVLIHRDRTWFAAGQNTPLRPQPT